MKQLITKSDCVTPIKSKLHALQKLDKLGIDRDLLIEENGQFYYETAQEQKEPDIVAEAVKEFEKPLPKLPKSAENTPKSISWETDVFSDGDNRTKLYIPGTDVDAVIMGKHPAGQNRSRNAFEISIDGETFIMSVDLLSKIFKVRG